MADRALELKRLGGATTALVLMKHRKALVRANAALVLANATHDDAALCVKLASSADKVVTTCAPILKGALPRVATTAARWAG